MNTELTPISDLEPGDQVYVPWPKDREKPESHTLPDVLTVQYVDLQKGQVIIKESGGLCLEAKELNRIIQDLPEAGDMITFRIEFFNNLGLCELTEFTRTVGRVDKDPLKRHPPKCIVEIDDKDYGIYFDEISKIEKAPPLKGAQLQMF